MSWKAHYSRFLAGHAGYLHLCAHSHHFWLDGTREAQLEAWDDAARLSDRKWDEVLSRILPEIQRGVAERLGLADPSRLTFASNTHELFVRLLSCFERGPVRILSTDSEFHSFRRQSARLVESGDVELTTVPQFPRETLAERLLATARQTKPQIIFLSHVFFNSGGVLPQAKRLLTELRAQCEMLVLDTYHSFLSRPIELGPLVNELFLLGGGYKYLQAGEGVCFLATPRSADALRPKNTGWYAHFASLGGAPTARTEYGEGAWRFWGSTFDPTAYYRLRYVLRFLREQGLDNEGIHRHSIELQERCLEILSEGSGDGWRGPLRDALPRILPAAERGNFLSFPLATGEAKRIQSELETRHILCDSRESASGSFLRFGFGLYHDRSDLEALR